MDRKISGIMTNKLNIFFDYKQISEKYLVYEFSTAQKHIKFNAKIFDADLMALGIVHESGKKFYALYSKNETNQSLISELLRKSEEGKNYSINMAGIKTVPQHLLLQLFLNALPNPQDNYFTFNNVTGKLYCINADSFKSSNGGIISEIPALEIKINNRLELEINIRTFTSLALKNKIIFNNSVLSCLDGEVEPKVTASYFFIFATERKVTHLDFCHFRHNSA